jgi:hypothetical protein
LPLEAAPPAAWRIVIEDTAARIVIEGTAARIVIDDTAARIVIDWGYSCKDCD